MKTVLLNLSGLGGPTFIGRDAGIIARAVLQLDLLEADVDNCFVIIIPADTYSINSSFVLGLFGPSIEQSKSISEFQRRYAFETHGKTYLAFERAYARAKIRYHGIID